jgi:fucose 4-O-acetylase-like acetyltransferase
MTIERKRLLAFDYFRGVSILLIVAGHSYDTWVIDKFFERVLANLITGGTALFVFISGFFFHYVFYGNFNYHEFIKKKLSLVFLPYLILSTIGISYYLLFSNNLPFGSVLELNEPESLLDYVYTYLIYIYTGRIVNAYWYMPFIIIIFALSPIFIRYIQLSMEKRLALFFVLLLFSMIIQRPLSNISPIHSVLYFISIYLLGINASLHIDRITNFLNGKIMMLGVATIGLAMLQAFFFEGHGNFHKESIFDFRGFDTIVIQKIAMSAFFLALLFGLERYNLIWLKSLATMSFAIFFIHPWVELIYSEIVPSSLMVDIPGFLTFIIRFVCVMTLSIGVASFIKLIFGRRSRYAIGW